MITDISGKSKILERYSYNNRTLIASYESESKIISMVIFNSIEQVNDRFKSMKRTKWGFVTYFVDNMVAGSETAQVIGLYIKDIENKNYWWENQ